MATEDFTPAEREALAPYFTNVDRPVFALVNLPETVKGALFARYSRSAKSLRRLFLDEFLSPDDVGSAFRRTSGRLKPASTGCETSSSLRSRVPIPRQARDGLSRSKASPQFLVMSVSVLCLFPCPFRVTSVFIPCSFHLSQLHLRRDVPERLPRVALGGLLEVLLRPRRPAVQ